MFLIAVVGMVVNVALVFVLKDAGEHAHSHGGLSGGAASPVLCFSLPEPRFSCFL